MIVCLIIFVFILGIVVGKWVTDHKWSSNAEVPQRIYHQRRLYKVTYDEDNLKDKLENFLKKDLKVISTPPCPKYGKEDGHLTVRNGGLFWECECGFCWWKDELELPKELKGD